LNKALIIFGDRSAILPMGVGKMVNFPVGFMGFTVLITQKPKVGYILFDLSKLEQRN
jgi:hypothetical protein